jgi:GMP synthase (glutamine-hydrolysing)
VVIGGPRDWRRIARVSTELTNNVRALNRVVILAGARAGERSVLHKAALTRPRLDLLRRADALCTSFLKSGGFYSRIWQMPVVLVPVGSRERPESLVLRP